MEEIFGSFRVEEDYTWRDDTMTITRRVIDEINDARLSNIAAHFDVDLSEIREFLDAKRRKHLAPMTNADKLRAMSDKELAVILAKITEPNKLPMFHGLFMNGEKDVWLDWLREEGE